MTNGLSIRKKKKEKLCPELVAHHVALFYIDEIMCSLDPKNQYNGLRRDNAM